VCARLSKRIRRSGERNSMRDPSRGCLVCRSRPEPGYRRPRDQDPGSAGCLGNRGGHSAMPRRRRGSSSIAAWTSAASTWVAPSGPRGPARSCCSTTALWSPLYREDRGARPDASAKKGGQPNRDDSCARRHIGHGSPVRHALLPAASLGLRSDRSLSRKRALGGARQRLLICMERSSRPLYADSATRSRRRLRVRLSGASPWPLGPIAPVLVADRRGEEQRGRPSGSKP
jgi:hypothetical protein